MGQRAQAVCPSFALVWIQLPPRSPNRHTHQNINEMEGLCETEAFPKMIKPLSIYSISLIHPSFIHNIQNCGLCRVWMTAATSLALHYAAWNNQPGDPILPFRVQQHLKCGRRVLRCQTDKFTHAYHSLVPISISNPLESAAIGFCRVFVGIVSSYRKAWYEA